MRHIVATGVTSGLGNEIINKFKNYKDKLYLLGRNIERVKYIEKNSSLYEIDFSNIDFSQGNKFYNDLFNNLSKKDEIILINCSGVINPINLIENLDTNEMINSLNVNLVWPMILIKEVVRITEATNSKLKIINISSGAAYNPLPGWSLYSTSKSAINTYLEVLIKEKKEYNIISVDPGVMDTKMQNYIRSIDIKSGNFNYINDFKDYKKNNILSSPEKIAKKIIYNYVDNWTAEEFYEKIYYKDEGY